VILLRSVVYFVLLVLTIVVFGLPLALFGLVAPQHWKDLWSNGWGRTNLWLQRVVCGLGAEIDGLENLGNGPCIVMAKHQSTWETIALRGLLPPSQSWVIKRELMWIPVFGWAMAVMHPIPIDRSAGRKAARQVIEMGSEALRAGRWVVIFPEGTRVAPGTRGRYGAGGAMLAEHSRFPVVPIAHNAGVFWKRRGIVKYPGTIRMVIGAPIQTEGLKAAEILRRVEGWIEDTVATLPARREGESPAPS
jgi:1-acyl-sn-glycerol-3-phosphate acyltransferase